MSSSFLRSRSCAPLCWSAAFASLLPLARVAEAQEVTVTPVVEVDRPGTPPDRPTAAGGDARYQIDRTTLYGDDARVPLPWVVVATSSFSYTNIGGDPTVVTGTGPTAGCKTPSGAP